MGLMTPVLFQCTTHVIMVFSRYINLHDIFLILAVVDCGTLTDPANGQVNHTAGTTFGQTATYSCNIGYNLVGNNTRVCQDTANWSQNAPTCDGMLLNGDLNFCNICTRNILSRHESTWEVYAVPWVEFYPQKTVDQAGTATLKQTASLLCLA